MHVSRAWYPPIAAALLLLSAGRPAAAQSPDAYFEFLMARRLETKGDQTGALAALERAASADPASATVRAEIAAFHLRRNSLPLAESEALKALTLDDSNLEAHRVLGLIYAANVDARNASTTAAQLDASARNAISHLERAAGDATTEIDLTIQYSLGRLYLRTGDTAKAVEAFTRVLNQNPTSVQGRLSLAQAYAAASDFTRAIATLDVIVGEEPRVASTLAQYQEEAGLLKEAVENYTRALAAEPTRRGLKVRRIAVLFNAREYARAAAFAAEAQTQHPDDLRFPSLRARALFEGGEPARALTVLEPAAKAFPKDAGVQFALADLYQDAGRDADAERTLRQLLAVDPSNADVLNYLGYMLAVGGRQLDEAIRLVQRALDVDPGNPAYLDSLGWAHFRRGELAQAEKYLSPAAERMPRNSVVQDHFGDLMAGQSRWLDAIEAWTRSLAGDGNTIDRTTLEKKIQDTRAKVPR